MEVDILNMAGEKVGTVELPARIFEAPINVDLMHQAYVRQMANARLGTHSTKSRSEVRGGGRKPWRQKGTGRARAGSIRAPHFVGGGGAHTPKPRDYSQSMPKKMRRAALRSALSVKAAEKDILVLEGLALEEARTKAMLGALKGLFGELSGESLQDGRKVLILVPEKNEGYERVARSARNLPAVKTLLANYLNVRDLLGYDKIILPVEAIEVLDSYLG
jgi:large subunit ribosomal protein L4